MVSKTISRNLVTDHSLIALPVELNDRWKKSGLYLNMQTNKLCDEKEVNRLIDEYELSGFEYIPLLLKDGSEQMMKADYYNSYNFFKYEDWFCTNFWYDEGYRSDSMRYFSESGDELIISCRYCVRCKGK